ncbi:DUF1156 domain-containing protein [Gimesia sp.]|uniref:DUF1156 domain-containing protein n=1 Tax=Gimesia sp. TaxID=2024833 RepID=UPI003A953E4F
MNYLKRLIEVDLPIARISAHARREKSIRHGHISTLHIWWARRPLAACRAVICASLWPDPADELCPSAFREAASELLISFAKRMFPARINEEGHQLQSTASKESRGRWEGLLQAEREGHPLDPHDAAHQQVLRGALLDFIADFANWDNSTVPAYLETSRALTQAAHETLGGVPGTRPLVVDPFAGGGSIPLEALRVGGDAFASDLNPVAVLLNKVVLEYIPKYGQRLADEVRKWGEWVKEQTEQELAGFYPKDQDGATPIAYLWARTIQCEGPGCGAEVPLLRSLWLAKKGAESSALRIVVDKKSKVLHFEIIDRATAKDVANPTSGRGAATCPTCGYTTPADAVKSQLKPRRGGSRDARLIAIRQDDPQTRRRVYRLPTSVDEVAAEKAGMELNSRTQANDRNLTLVPDEPYPNETGAGALSSSVLYGFESWGDIFTPRQALALTTFIKYIDEACNMMVGDDGLRLATRTCLAQSLNRLADFSSSLCRLNSTGGRGVVNTFSRQALPMMWDFLETNPFNDVGANWAGSVDTYVATIEAETANIIGGHAERASATNHILPDGAAAAFVTDPPYYDAIAYGDLSDFFYVWLRRTLADHYPSLLRESLVDKTDEVVHLSKRFRGPYSHKTASYFENGMQMAMREGRRVLASNGIGVVVFAHKSTSGWEAMLSALIDSGWKVTGSWPVDTERGGRMNAIGTASLASSVHIVCRPRINDAVATDDKTGEWRDVLSELPKRIHEWMPRLAAEGVVGADSIFACLGPALEIFSRYSRVEKASGEAVPLREYLEQVWATVSTEALSMIFKDADAVGLEPDARLTAMWLWTLGGMDTNGNGSPKKNDTDEKVVTSTGYTLEYDAARKIAQGLGIHLEQSDSIVEVSGDKARLLSVRERTRHLFGKDEPAPRTARGRKKPKAKQLDLFKTIDELEAEAEETAAGELKPQAGETVLDRVHQSMILFASGRGEALRRFLVDDGAGNDARFWKLAQSLSALYPKETDEKRWVDGVLARKKGLGL